MDAPTIGQYRVTGLIGRGGMGVVYAAEHTLLGRPAAIKVLLPELSQKQDVVMRFFNEARAATAIRHPGIVEIYDFGWTPDGAAYIVMECLEGETLARRASRVRLRWSGVLAVARQIAGALAAAHAKGIVHRDLKPDNVFLVTDPEVPGGERIKLLDFGIAKLAVDSTTSSNVTKTGAVMGTPTYMAPEQCRGVVVDHRADLYALGCVIYELCCGRPPFLGEGTGDVLAAHIHLPVPPMATHGAELPPAVEQLVRHLLAKVPADRVQSAEELIRAIDAVTTEQAAVSSSPRRAMSVMTSPTVTTLSGSASTSMLMPGGRRRWPIAAFSIGLAAITVVIVALVMRHGAGAPVIASHPTEPSAVPLPAQSVPAAPHDQPPPPTAAPAPAAPPAAEDPSARRDPVVDPPAAPAPGEPAAPDPGRAEPRASSGSGAPRTAPRPPSAAGGSREPAPHAQGPGGTIDVAVDSAPAGAQVVLDGAVLGTTPYRGTLTRRDRDIKLVLRLPGYADRIVLARESQPISERVTLVRKAAPPAAKSSKTDHDRSVNPF
jgi:eukaryotic-like serine/threonine-protein kinase